MRTYAFFQPRHRDPLARTDRRRHGRRIARLALFAIVAALGLLWTTGVGSETRIRPDVAACTDWRDSVEGAIDARIRRGYLETGLAAELRLRVALLGLECQGDFPENASRLFAALLDFLTSEDDDD